MGSQVTGNFGDPKEPCYNLQSQAIKPSLFWRVRDESKEHLPLHINHHGNLRGALIKGLFNIYSPFVSLNKGLFLGLMPQTFSLNVKPVRFLSALL